MTADAEIFKRLRRHAGDWRVDIDLQFETESSLIAFGSRAGEQVVLKVTRQPGDEWYAGEILQAFNAKGFVRVYQHAPGVVLLERLAPGRSLLELSLKGKDEEAIAILADVIAQMSLIERSPNPNSTTLLHCPTIHKWARGFEQYAASGDGQIPKSLVDSGRQVFLELCASQVQPRLLHGDLQHYNVLFDSNRGWLAIDPKGVFGELEYEVGAMMRNPVECPDLFLSSQTIERRLEQLATRLNLDRERALRWTFAQAVLSAIWEIEDGHPIDARSPVLRLAEMTREIIQA